MLKATPEERAILWKDAVDSATDVRSVRLRVLAKEVQDAVAAQLDLYSHDDLFEETFELLGATGRVGRDDLRIAFEDVDETDDGPLDLIAVLADLLTEGIEDPHLQPDDRVRSARLVEAWREVFTGQPSGAGFWSVADVARHFGVTPQAVYRWIDRDRIEWRRRPGGSYLIPSSQFDAIEPMSLKESARRPRLTPDAELRFRLSSARSEDVDHAEDVDPSDPTRNFTRAGSVARRRPLRRSSQ